MVLLGAGFSKAIAAQMPTLPELTRHVLQRLGDRLRPGILPAFALTNIEVALALLRTRHPWLSEGE